MDDIKQSRALSAYKRKLDYACQMAALEGRADIGPDGEPLDEDEIDRLVTERIAEYLPVSTDEIMCYEADQRYISEIVSANIPFNTSNPEAFMFFRNLLSKRMKYIRSGNSGLETIAMQPENEIHQKQLYSIVNKEYNKAMKNVKLFLKRFEE